VGLHKDVIIWDAQSGLKYGEHAIADLVRKQNHLETRGKAAMTDCDVPIGRSFSAASTIS
jgi:hypothetical protein